MPAEELAEKIGITPKTIKLVRKKKKGNEDLVANFETYYSEDGKKCIKRKDN